MPLNLTLLGPLALSVVYFVVLVAVSYTDLRWRRIPNRLIYPAILLALIAALLTSSLLEALAGGLAGMLLFGIPMLVLGPSRAGAGDAKLALFMGLVLTFPVVLYGIAFACLSALLVIVPGVLLKRWNRSTVIPFGPFLALAMAVFLLLRVLVVLGFVLTA